MAHQEPRPVWCLITDQFEEAPFGARGLIYASFILLFTGIGVIAVAPILLSVFVAQLCVGLAIGIGYPVLMGMSIQQVDDSERTTAMGLHQAVYSVGMFAGPGLSGALADVMGIRSLRVTFPNSAVNLTAIPRAPHRSRWSQRSSCLLA